MSISFIILKEIDGFSCEDTLHSIQQAAAKANLHCVKVETVKCFDCLRQTDAEYLSGSISEVDAETLRSNFEKGIHSKQFGFDIEPPTDISYDSFHHVVDANFDGFQDFGYLFHAGNQPYYRHYWLWDENQGQFQYCASLVEISQPVFDPERQVITGWARNSGAGDGINTFHRWEDGELVCVRRIESFSSWEEPSVVCVQDRINGELQQVYREEFPWPGEEPEGQEAWRQARYKWCDLDYHGEP